jgi:hypothetical protein
MSTATAAAAAAAAPAEELDRARTIVGTVRAGIASIAQTMTEAGADPAAAEQAATNAVLAALLTDRPGMHTAYHNGLRLLAAAE